MIFSLLSFLLNRSLVYVLSGGIFLFRRFNGRHPTWHLDSDFKTFFISSGAANDPSPKFGGFFSRERTEKTFTVFYLAALYFKVRRCINVLKLKTVHLKSSTFPRSRRYPMNVSPEWKCLRRIWNCGFPPRGQVPGIFRNESLAYQGQ